MPAAGRSRSRGLSPPTFLTLYTSPGSGLTHPHCSQEEQSRDQDASRQAEEEVDLQRGFLLSELTKPFPAALWLVTPWGRFPSAHLSYCTTTIHSLPATPGGHRPALAPPHLFQYPTPFRGDAAQDMRQMSYNQTFLVLVLPSVRCWLLWCGCESSPENTHTAGAAALLFMGSQAHLCAYCGDVHGSGIMWLFYPWWKLSVCRLTQTAIAWHFAELPYCFNFKM